MVKRCASLAPESFDEDAAIQSIMPIVAEADHRIGSKSPVDIRHVVVGKEISFATVAVVTSPPYTLGV